MSLRQIAALYVESGGVYTGREGVRPYTVDNDARLYRGPFSVVAHPPCKRWGRYWSGGPSANVRRLKGDDEGCFAHALWAVRTFGGVLEHPEASHAWRWFGLSAPPRAGGWVRADGHGWTCCVEQGHYGHRARKATWLYVVTEARLPELAWGQSEGERLDEGFHSREERAASRAAGQKPRKRLSSAENLATPAGFAEVLLGIARDAGRL